MDLDRSCVLIVSAIPTSISTARAAHKVVVFSIYADGSESEGKRELGSFACRRWRARSVTVWAQAGMTMMGEKIFGLG